MKETNVRLSDALRAGKTGKQVLSRGAMFVPSRVATSLSLGLLVCFLTARPARPEEPVLRFEELVRRNPIQPGETAKVFELLRGEQASINVWQMTRGMPAHLHRKHDEIIIVESGRANTRVGDKNINVGPGDTLVVRRGTVHGATVIGDEPFRGWSIFTPPFDGKDRVPVPEPSP
jgi:quercetin dioxygenase-like cupin family protein